MNIQLCAELPGHDDRAWQIAWNPAKPLLASCSTDKTVRLYSYRNDPHDPSNPIFSHLTTIPTLHTKTVRSVAWSPSGNTFATGSFDASVGIYAKSVGEDDSEDPLEPEGWELVYVIEGHETECKSVAYSAMRTSLATCSGDKSVWIWEVKPDSEFECMMVMQDHSQDVKCVAWHPTQEVVFVLVHDRFEIDCHFFEDRFSRRGPMMTQLISTSTIQPKTGPLCFTTLSGHAGTVWSVAWAPCRDYLASSSDDLTIRIWRRSAEHAWEFAHQSKGHTRSIYSISWGTGKGDHLGWLASTGSDGTINIWEISESRQQEGTGVTVSSKLIASVSSAHGIYDVNSVQWCPRSEFENLLSTAADDGSVKVWRLSPTE